PAGAAARLDPRSQVALAGARRTHDHPVVLGVADRDLTEVRATQLARALADATEDRVEVERCGDLAREVGEDLGLPAPMIGVTEPPRALVQHLILTRPSLGVS